MKFAFFDLDGTLVDNTSRKTVPPETYYTPEYVVNLPANPKVVKEFSLCQTQGFKNIIVSGRHSGLMGASNQWVLNNLHSVVLIFLRVYANPATRDFEKIENVFRFIIQKIHFPDTFAEGNLDAVFYDDDEAMLNAYQSIMRMFKLPASFFKVTAGEITPHESPVTKVVKAYEEYLEVLNSESVELTSIALNHNWTSSRVEQGRLARDKVRLAKESL